MSILAQAAIKTAKEVGMGLLLFAFIAMFLLLAAFAPLYAAVLLIVVLISGVFYGNYQIARREKELEEARTKTKLDYKALVKRIEENNNIFQSGSSPKAGSEVKITCTGGCSGCGDKSTS